MATKIPLNYYRRISNELTTVPASIYETPTDRASVIISALVTNTTTDNKTVTFSISSSETGEFYDIIKNLQLGPNEVISLLPSKVVAGAGDEFIVSGDTITDISINDPGVFWLFDLPTDAVTLSGFQIDITPPGVVNINWGSSDYRYRLPNQDFDEWDNTTVTKDVTAGPVINTAAKTFVMGTGLNTGSVGTYTVSRQDTTPTDRSYFNTTFYARVANSISVSATSPIESGQGRGEAFLATNNGSIAPASLYLGKPVTFTFWARASKPTKIISENQVHSYDKNMWTPVQYKIFDLTTEWQQFTHSYTMPTYDQVYNIAYDPNTVNIDNPVYTPLKDTTGMPNVSSWYTQTDIKTIWDYHSFTRHGNNPNRPVGFPGSAMTTQELSAVCNNFILNGYYDIASMRFTIGDGSTYTSDVSGNSTSTYNYDPAIDTDVNITLSLQETVNIP